MYPGCNYTGKIIVNSIGLPHILLSQDSIKQEAHDKTFIENHLNKRPRDAYKGSCGKSFKSLQVLCALQVLPYYQAVL